MIKDEYYMYAPVQAQYRFGIPKRILNASDIQIGQLFQVRVIEPGQLIDKIFGSNKEFGIAFLQTANFIDKYKENKI